MKLLVQNPLVQLIPIHIVIIKQIRTLHIANVEIGRVKFLQLQYVYEYILQDSQQQYGKKRYKLQYVYEYILQKEINKQKIKGEQNMIKVMKYQIIKPIDTDWEMLGNILYNYKKNVEPLGTKLLNYVGNIKVLHLITKKSIVNILKAKKYWGILI